MIGKRVCGIDFGTSNSAIAIGNADGPSLVPFEGKTTIPSSIFFRAKAGPVFGRAATSAYLDGEEGRLMRGLKKILGTSLMSDKTGVGGRQVAFTEILQIFISHLKAGAEDACGGEVADVVMGRPVHFHDGNADADKKAESALADIARQAGFGHVEFLYEPIAAAFAHEQRVAGEKLSLVIDLGGGTSDFTVIKLAPHRQGKADRRDDILANAGVRVGGTNFDARLSLKSFMPELGLGTYYRDMFDSTKRLAVPTRPYFELSDWALVNYAQTPKAISETRDIGRKAEEPDKIGRLLRLQQERLGHMLLGVVEAAKIHLTDTADYSGGLADLDPDLDFAVTRTEFEAAVAGDIDKIFSAVKECLALAGIKADAIDLIIMTGGSSELPVIESGVRAMFPHAMISQDNRLDSVGLGLGCHAANIFGTSA